MLTTALKESPRAFLQASGLTTVALLLIVCLLNYMVDPAHLFDETNAYEHGIAKLLAQGNNVAGFVDCDERILQRARARQEDRRAIDWLVIGSSRSMPITQAMLGASMMNMSVSAATIEDYVAIHELAGKFSPKNVILGVDPWIFNRNNGHTLWKSIAAEYAAGIDNMVRESGQAMSYQDDMDLRHSAYFVNKFLQLINFEYTKFSLRKLRTLEAGGRARYVPKQDDSAEQDKALIRVDGSWVQPLTVANRNPDEVREMAKTYARPPVFSLEKFDRLDAANSRIFEALLNHIKKRSNPVIYLPPYHPVTYNLIEREYPAIKQAEQYVRSVAAAKGIRVVGSYNPDICMCGESEFSDGMHAKPACVNKTLGSLRVAQ